MVAEDLLFFVVPIAVFQVRESIGECGLAYFLLISARLLSYPVAGFLSDRLGGKRVFTLSVLLRGLLCSAFFLILHEFGSTSILTVLICITVGEGVLGAFSSVSFDAFLSRINLNVPQARLQAFVQAADQVAVLLGPVLGAFLFKKIEFRTILMIASAMNLGVFTIILCLKAVTEVAKARENASGTTFWKDSIHAFQWIGSDRFLLSLLLLTLLDNFMIGIQGATIVPIVLGHFKESEQTLGLVNALGGTVALASVMISPSLLNRTSAYSLWLMSSLLGYLGFLETGFASSFKAYAIGLGIVEIACGIGIYSLRVMRASLIPFSDQGKTLGMIYFLQQLSLPLGGFIMGVFSEIEGLQSLIIQTTLLCGLLAVPLFLLGRAAKSVHSERAIS